MDPKTPTETLLTYFADLFPTDEDASPGFGPVTCRKLTGFLRNFEPQTDTELELVNLADDALEQGGRFTPIAHARARQLCAGQYAALGYPADWLAERFPDLTR